MNRIKKLRNENNLTVAQLAKKVNISQSMLSNYENGNSQPRDRKIWKNLAEALNTDPAYLMGTTNKMDRVNATDLAENLAHDQYEKEKAANIAKLVQKLDGRFVIAGFDTYDDSGNVEKPGRADKSITDTKDVLEGILSLTEEQFFVFIDLLAVLCSSNNTTSDQD